MWQCEGRETGKDQDKKKKNKQKTTHTEDISFSCLAGYGIAGIFFFLRLVLFSLFLFK